MDVTNRLWMWQFTEYGKLFFKNQILTSDLSVFFHPNLDIGMELPNNIILNYFGHNNKKIWYSPTSNYGVIEVF